MRKPDCILLRVGELALKSEQVQKKWFRILLENVEAGLKNIEHKTETNPNRVFVYTDSSKAEQNLKRIFGVVSLSECWVCHSDLDDMRLLASEIAKNILKLNQKKSFAIDARCSGCHKFSSHTIEEEVGAAVKRVTDAQVKLKNSQHTIHVECRSNKTYIFTGKTHAVGGLPLGVSGTILAVIKNEKDALSAWLLMRRGCTLEVISKNKKLIDLLKKWHTGKEMVLLKNIQDTSAQAVIGKKIKDFLVLDPLIGLPAKKVKAYKLLMHN